MGQAPRPYVPKTAKHPPGGNTIDGLKEGREVR